jgi:hypothetical protein
MPAYICMYVYIYGMVFCTQYLIRIPAPSCVLNYITVNNLKILAHLLGVGSNIEFHSNDC